VHELKNLGSKVQDWNLGIAKRVGWTNKKGSYCKRGIRIWNKIGKSSNNKISNYI